MESILKDVLGIIVLKLNVGDVLNLRATCKHLNTNILHLKKYWFFQYFLKNKFKMLLNKKLLRHVHGVEKKMLNGETFLFPYTFCMTNISTYEMNEKFGKDPDYETWKSEANTLGFYDGGLGEGSKYETAYCRMKYLEKSDKNFICPDLDHYDVKPFSEIRMFYVNIIDEKILKCYEQNTDYFRSYLKYMYSQHIIKKMRNCTTCEFEHDVSIERIQEIISEDFNRKKRDTREEIEEVEGEIKDLRKGIEKREKDIEKKEQYLKDEEEISKKNMEVFLQLKEEMNKIFKK
jgi:hypothetical protein